MNDLSISLETDFSDMFGDIFDINEPAEEYSTPVFKIFGKEPNKNDIIRVLDTQLSEATQILSDWMELEIEENIVKEVIENAARNYFGKSIREDD